MKAKIAYLTSPAPNRFVLNFQPEGTNTMVQYEISKGHLANIVITATDLAWRETSLVNRVPFIQQDESAEHEPDRRQQPA